MSQGWHILREGGRVTLARHLPVRMDLSVQTRLPLCRAVPLAHMIRQDMWRLLRGLRGFSPVVIVDKGPGDMLISAGGCVAGGPVAPALVARLAALLEQPAARARWVRWAA